MQRRVAIAAAGVGVGAVGQQHHGAVQAAPLHGDVQRHVGRAAAGVHLRAVLQQQPRQLLPRARTVAGTDKAAVSTSGWALQPSRPHGKQSGGTGGSLSLDSGGWQMPAELFQALGFLCLLPQN